VRCYQDIVIAKQRACGQNLCRKVDFLVKERSIEVDDIADNSNQRLLIHTPLFSEKCKSVINKLWSVTLPWLWTMKAGNAILTEKIINI